MPTISLCVISGNEACHIERFLKSFGSCFDELCLVRAIANNRQDNTVSLAKAWCEKNGKTFKFAEYRNHGWQPGLPENLDVKVFMPETWKHVDSFGDARNLSWSLATGDWILWADLDDVLEAGGAEAIRVCATGGDKYDFFYFTYNIRTSGETNFRERMFKRGISKWTNPVHETCHVVNPPQEKVRSSHESSVVYSHEPEIGKERDPDRNMRILEYHMRFHHMFPFELHREYYYRWQAYKKDDDKAKAVYWADLAQIVETPSEQRATMYLNLAEVAAFEKDYDRAIELCWTAARLQPWLRDPWCWMAEYELLRNNPKRAIFFSETAGKLNKVAVSGFPAPERFYTWRGMHLHLRCLAAGGQHDRARKIEADFFAKHGKRFSLLHATRGRPELAIKTRDYFFQSAVIALGVEHIFAIDEDDTESLEKLKHFHHVVVKNPNGCVKAWNEAAKASTGQVLVQLSDDWIPCLEWDEKAWKAIGDTSKPAVLAISDSHRTDALLCMAILTRARYERQRHPLSFGYTMDGTEYPTKLSEPFMFHPDFFGVYSDNWFTHCAYRDGVVIDATKQIRFIHSHPIWDNVPLEEMDETYRKQNAPDRYSEGHAIFNRLLTEESTPALSRQG